MKLSISIYLLIFLIASCNNENNSANSGPKAENSKKSSPINCYRYASSNDTIILKLIHVGESITGILVYKLKEKDKNQGAIQGYMRGNILVANYTFLSEGSTSIRQIAFKKETDSFIEGFGDIVTTDNKTVFRNIDSLNYNSSFKLIEIDCEK
jgi:hypothetical protein